MHYVYTQHKYYYYTHAANAAIALYAKCAFNVRDIKLAIARIRHTLSIVDVHYEHYLRVQRVHANFCPGPQAATHTTFAYNDVCQ